MRELSGTKPEGGMKVTAGNSHRRPPGRSLNLSMFARTGKMENYACQGHMGNSSRLVVVLTRKSFVMRGYRGSNRAI